MILGGVAGIAAHVKTTHVHEAQLLHSDRTVNECWPAFESQLRQQVVGALGGAGVGAGKYLRVRHDKSFSAGNGFVSSHCGAGEVNERVDVGRLDRAAVGQQLALGE